MVLTIGTFYRSYQQATTVRVGTFATGNRKNT